MPYTIRWDLREVALDDHDLKSTTDRRRKEDAKRLVASAISRTVDRRGQISGVLGQELRDWVLRAGERYVPLPDHTLDTYWRAKRGIPGFYSPLALGVGSGKNYLSLGGAGDIGEGVALAVLESVAPHGLGQRMICRILGDAPDMILQPPDAGSAVRVLAEVKTTESAEPDAGLEPAVDDLLRVYQGWQRHYPLAQTVGLAVSVLLTEHRTFTVRLLRLSFRGSDVPGLSTFSFDADGIAEATRASWAGDHLETARLLGQVAGESREDTSPEVDHFARLQAASIVLHTSQSDLDTSVTATGVAQAMQRVGVRLLPKAGSLAAASLRKVLAAREETPGISLDALRDRRVATPETEWRTFMSERADGIELRAYRRGRWVESLTAASAALQRLCTDDQFARERVGFRAASLWLRGVEWTVYADGRVQAWIPETSTDSSERLELERDAARLIAAW